MSEKTTKHTTKSTFQECALTGVIFDGRFSPLRLMLKDGGLQLDLTDKKLENSIFIDIDKNLINGIISGKRKLPDAYQVLVPDDLKPQIIELYQKKFYSLLGFLLKTGQAVIGRRAIDRAIITGDNEKSPFAILLTPEGSEAIVKSFKFKKSDLKVVENFPQDWLINVTGREKISYYCILGTTSGISFFNDYTRYLKLINN